MEAAFLLYPCLLLPFEDLGELNGTLTKSHQLAGLTYTFHMDYIVEDGTSYKRVYQLPASRLGGVVGNLR